MKEILKRFKKEQRDFIYFDLTGDTAFDKITLCAVEYAARSLRMEENATKVIQVHLVPVVSYEQFIQLIDIMKRESQSAYSYWNDDFYAWEINNRDL